MRAGRGSSRQTQNRPRIEPEPNVNAPPPPPGQVTTAVATTPARRVGSMRNQGPAEPEVHQPPPVEAVHPPIRDGDHNRPPAVPRGPTQAGRGRGLGLALRQTVNQASHANQSTSHAGWNPPRTLEDMAEKEGRDERRRKRNRPPEPEVQPAPPVVGTVPGTPAFSFVAGTTPPSSVAGSDASGRRYITRGTPESAEVPSPAAPILAAEPPSRQSQRRLYNPTRHTANLSPVSER